MRFPKARAFPAFFLAAAAAVATGWGAALLATCGPFTDVSDAAFCPFVLEVFTLGITTGTTATTYDPSSSVTRLQMAAFLSRTVDGTLKRGSRRAALNQFWTPPGATGLGLTTLPGGAAGFLCSDGADVWAGSGNNVCRVRASDGKLLDTWSAIPSPQALVAAAGRIYIAAVGDTPGRVWRIDPTQPGTAAQLVASNLGTVPIGIAFDGLRLWVADSLSGDVSIVTVGPSIPYPVTIVSTGFASPWGVLYDGANVWVTDMSAGTLLKLDGSGAILQTVTVGTQPYFPIFDGTNIWVPDSGSASIHVVRRSTGAILATLTGNGLNSPFIAAFDGERVLVTNFNGNTVSVYKAADLTTIGNFSTGSATKPFGACSDGSNFFIGLFGTSQVAKF